MGVMLDTIGQLIAGYLQTELPGYEPFTPSDPEYLRGVIAPGDVLLVEGNNRISGIIKYLTQSTWSHAALYVGPVDGAAESDGEPHVLIEANVGEGVNSAPLSKYFPYHTRVCRPVGLSYEDRTTVCRYAINRIGFGYDTKNIIDLMRYLFPLPVPQRDEKAHQIDDVLGVVAEADAVDGIAAHRGAVLIGQSDRTADTGVIAEIFRQRRRDHAVADIGFDQHVRLAVVFLRAVDRPDIERGVGPGRLGQVFDDAGDAVVAFDEQDVAGLDDAAQKFRIARRERLIARYLLLKVAGQQLADPIEHNAHNSTSPRRPCAADFSFSYHA